MLCMLAFIDSRLGFYLPLWVLLVVIYWLMFSKHGSFGVYCAAFVGLIVDGLLGFPLGVHMLVYGLVASVCVLVRLRFVVANAFTQVLSVGLFVLLHHLALSLVITCVEMRWLVTHHWIISVVVSMLLWPWLNVLLHSVLRHKQLT